MDDVRVSLEIAGEQARGHTPMTSRIPTSGGLAPIHAHIRDAD